MSLYEEIKEFSGYSLNETIFNLECAINTLRKLKVGFVVNELCIERKEDVIANLDLLADFLKENQID